MKSKGSKAAHMS